MWERSASLFSSRLQSNDAQFDVKKTNYNPLYRVELFDGKGRVADFLKAQPSLLGEGMTWSCVTTGAYVEMLKTVSIITHVSSKNLANQIMFTPDLD